MSDIMAFLSANWVEILAVVVALEKAGELIARLTPTSRDDAFFAKVSSWLDRMAHMGLKKK